MARRKQDMGTVLANNSNLAYPGHESEDYKYGSYDQPS
eukprot:CAMPEP_0113972028 /NCGR_PEP_ID=MMETSP0011_2-20120614/12871_1 /TAXON_ID=101924 /ORGANISM="Rhodosorus marinus" /LENGTH=37 /DNA_ID=CAMNT_0000988203 /DNA_START=1225 /DNA_END=1334 /DNA_ORIENTATION=+ /assembly_acc=CAM_ASM_000156